MAPVIKEESEAPAAKRTKRDYTNTLKVIVGPANHEFTVHTELAIAKSSLFKTVTSEKWFAGQERVVRLPEQDAQAFEVFVHWIYSDKLDFANLEEIATSRPPSYLICGKVWALAHSLGASQLQNKAIDRIIQKVARGDSKNVTLESLKKIWQFSPPGSTIRRLFTDVVASGSRGQRDEEEAKELPEEIMFEAAVRNLYGDNKTTPTMKDRCNYHDHAEGEPKCG